MHCAMFYPACCMPLAANAIRIENVLQIRTNDVEKVLTSTDIKISTASSHIRNMLFRIINEISHFFPHSHSFRFSQIVFTIQIYISYVCFLCVHRLDSHFDVALNVLPLNI